MRIGIDLGGTKTEGIVMDAAGTTVHRIRRPTPRVQGYSAIIEAIALLVADLEQQAGTRCSVGIGTPGAVSRRTGTMKNCNTTCLNGQPLRQDLEARLGREVRMANDANCFALSEALDGAAAGHKVVFGVILGTGVGGGIILSGQVHDGPNDIAGEWGHTPLEHDGPACYCGRRGCVETFLSGPGLAADFQRVTGEEGVDGPAIVARAQRGDGAAQGVMQRYLERFGRALATVVDILDPDAIVLGGGLSGIDLLYSEGPAAIARHVFSDELCTPVLRNRHGDSSGVRGAAMLWPVHSKNR